MGESSRGITTACIKYGGRRYTVNRPASHTSPSILAVSIILVLLSASGMLAGITAHRLQASPSATPTPIATTLAQATIPVQPKSTPTATALPTATTSSAETATAAPNAQFTFSVSAAPKTVAPGQAITITVAVVQKGTQTPLAGVQCFLRQTTTGGQSLFMQFPPAATSNANGQAIWNLTVPAQPPGTYRVEAVAYGAHSYSYYSFTDVIVTA